MRPILTTKVKNWLTSPELTEEAYQAVTHVAPEVEEREEAGQDYLVREEKLGHAVDLD